MVIEKKLSFFVPFYNEEKHLQSTSELILEAAAVSLTDFEIILVNDGSTDSSQMIAEQLALKYKNIRVLNLEQNAGFGTAYISGLLNARFGHAMYLSADGDAHAEELQFILQNWDGKKSLLQYAKNPNERHFFRFCLSTSFTILVNLFSDSNWPYYNGYNIYNLAHKSRLQFKNFGFATQAYTLLTLFRKPEEVLLLATESRFNDSASKSVTLRNINRAFLFFCFIIRNKI